MPISWIATRIREILRAKQEPITLAMVPLSASGQLNVGLHAQHPPTWEQTNWG